VRRTLRSVRIRNPGAPVLGILGVEPPHPSNAPLAANSAGMIRRLSSGGHYNVTNGAWGQMEAPVFYADASTPRYTWGAHCGAISGKQVPIPPGSHEAQGPVANTDHKYIVIDTDAKLAYDIWGPTSRDATTSSGATRAPG